MYRQSEKNLLNTNTSSTCPDNMGNFGLLTAEICCQVWGTPANFNGFRVLAALLHGSLAVGVSQTAALNRGRHLYSVGRPSRWALAHISSFSYSVCICHLCWADSTESTPRSLARIRRLTLEHSLLDEKFGHFDTPSHWD